MTRIHGFPPLLGQQPRALVLGTMPSVASLERQQYYGKPQNAFWRLMGELFGAGPELDYAERVAHLTRSHVAVWDVLASCIRPGSLDSAIEMRGAQVNDICGLLKQYPEIRSVIFNGRKAEQIYQRRVQAEVAAFRTDIKYFSLPSTSPAMAALSFAEKLERWHVLRDAAGAAS